MTDKEAILERALKDMQNEEESSYYDNLQM